MSLVKAPLKEEPWLEILHFQEREQGKTSNLKNSFESDIENANVCFYLFDDDDAEDDDSVDVV